MADIPETITDLKPHPRNPRAGTPDEAAGLHESMTRFGDISGIVWNKRTGTLVCGHARVAELQGGGGVLEAVNGTVAAVAANGERFPVRVVDWDEPMHMAAMIAANNRHIARDWTTDLGGVLDTLEVELPELSKSLRLDELRGDVPGAIKDGAGADSPLVKENLPPPKVAWYLLRVPLDRLEKAQSLIGQLQEIDGVVTDSTVR